MKDDVVKDDVGREWVKDAEGAYRSLLAPLKDATHKEDSSGRRGGVRVRVRGGGEEEVEDEEKEEEEEDDEGEVEEEDIWWSFI